MQNRMKWLPVIIILLVLNLFTQQSISAEELNERSIYDSITENKGKPVNKSEQNEENAEEDGELFSSSTESNVFVLLLQLVFYTGLVVALIYGLTKLLSSRRRQMGKNQLFQTIAGISLGQNRSLQLVKFGDRLYLLGVADQIDVIKEIDNPDEIQQIEKEWQESGSAVSRQVLNWFQTKPSKNEKEDTRSFQQLFNDSLHSHRKKREQFEEKVDSNGRQKRE